MELIKKETGITSLEIARQINVFRIEEGNRTELAHSDLLKIIRDEFEEEIGEGKIFLGSYIDKSNRQKPTFSLNREQLNRLAIRMKIPKLIEIEGVDVLHVRTKTRFETSFLNMLEEILEEFGIYGIRQYNVDGYRLDFYIPELNVAIEYDEEQHFTKTNMKIDITRQEYISNKLNCLFVRCDYEVSDIKNCATVIKTITGGK